MRPAPRAARVRYVANYGPAHDALLGLLGTALGSAGDWAGAGQNLVWLLVWYCMESLQTFLKGSMNRFKFA